MSSQNPGLRSCDFPPPTAAPNSLTAIDLFGLDDCSVDAPQRFVIEGLKRKVQGKVVEAVREVRNSWCAMNHGGL
jgi:hypothetical protein